jgi:hypothetical protein
VECRFGRCPLNLNGDQIRQHSRRRDVPKAEIRDLSITSPIPPEGDVTAIVPLIG